MRRDVNGSEAIEMKDEYPGTERASENRNYYGERERERVSRLPHCVLVQDL